LELFPFNTNSKEEAEMIFEAIHTVVLQPLMHKIYIAILHPSKSVSHLKYITILWRGRIFYDKEMVPSFVLQK